ncbi:hypothetical protein WDU99_13395 [Microbacterium sp. Mu-80]|uniref:Uncharacterized protein n=1 Tax=Microbacterium bandirmense TaxID=3122050 RepID=A0ABU8LE61_9MICO
MYDEADGARRRELERRAYAPGGALSDAEAEELRELSRRPVVLPLVPERPSSRSAVPERGAQRRDEGRSGTAVGDAPVPDQDVRSPLPVPERGAERRDEGAPADPEAPTEPDAPAPPKRRRRWLAPVAAGAALLIGFGGGWLAFGGEDAEPMTDAQREIWLELQASDRYDPGSVELIGAQHGVDAWHALSEDGDNECLILTGPDHDPSPACVPQNLARENPYALQASTNFEEDGAQIMVWASIIEDIHGERTVTMQRQNVSDGWDWRSTYTEEELPIAEFLDEEGFDGNSLTLLGYDEKTPVWLSQYNSACLLVATADEMIAQACDEPDTEQNIELQLPDRVYRVTMGSMRGPTLTIIRTPDPVVCDVDSGYCATADDKTGELGG